MSRLFALLTIIFALGCGGQPQSTDTAANQAQTPINLWEVSKDGGEKSHLFGTCHMGITLDEAFTPVHRAVFDEAKLVVLEADILNVDQTQLFVKGQLVGGKHLRDMISEPVWNLLLVQLKDRLPAPVIDRLRPWLVNAVLSNVLINSENSPDVSVPMDMAIAKIAQERGTEMGFAETIDDFFASKAKHPLDVELKDLEDAVLHPENMLNRVDAILNVCRPGGFPAFQETFDISEVLAKEEATFKLRNNAWMPKIKQFVDQGGSFIAVGAGHLLGPDGLVAQLESAGYTVTQLSAPIPQLPLVEAADSEGDPAETAEATTTPEPEGDKGASMVRMPPELKQEFLKKFQSGFAKVFCKPEAIFRVCFSVDEKGCQERVFDTLGLCFDQHMSILSRNMTREQGNALGSILGSCTGSAYEITMRMDGMYRDSEQCQATVAAISKQAAK